MFVMFKSFEEEVRDALVRGYCEEVIEVLRRGLIRLEKW